MPEVLYEERQRVENWIFALLVALVVGGLGWAYTVDDDSSPYVIIAVMVCMVAFLANLCTLRTVVKSGEVYVRLGCLVPCYWRRLPIDTIRSARAVTYRPLRDAGGWGVRFGKFEGRYTSFLNIRGNRGVWIDTGARPLIVGSDAPEALWRAIEKARHSTKGK
ncbi:MAG: hypothetical protein K1Y02_20890 [Candidatus Hydrogenedentes bacterium]|nr:hypothetical protein [Candidatus Hydrogenedentota bacterium]